MIYLIRLTLFQSFFLLSCSDETPAKHPSQPEDMAQPVAYWINDSLGNSLIDTTYMTTGFYLLAGKTEPGVKMRMDRSDEIYAINPEPFASVKTFRDVRIERSQHDNNVYTSLCITMDEQGTQDLKKGLANSLNKDIAVVIANRLLYVARNKMATSNGTMCISMQSYTEDEIEAMRKAVEQKR
jgi:hypothetical protein